MSKIEYDRLSYKKYKAFCYKEREELIEEGCEVDFQMLSFENFVEKLNNDNEFAKVWGYWNFI